MCAQAYKMQHILCTQLNQSDRLSLGGLRKMEGTQMKFFTYLQKMIVYYKNHEHKSTLAQIFLLA